MTTLRDLDDEKIVNQLAKLVQSDREVTAELLRYLAEVDRRKLYVERGYSSLLGYCVNVLHMAEPSSFVRIAAARCSQRYPRIIELLRQGALHLSAIRLLSPHLTEDNCDELFAAASHKSKRQVEQLVNSLAPKPDVPATMRKLPTPKPKETAPTQPAAAATPPLAPCTTPLALAPTSPVPAATTRPAAHPEPLGLARYKVQFTASQPLHDLIEQAQDLMRQRNRCGDLAILFEAALEVFVRSELKRQHGATTKPTSSPWIWQRAAWTLSAP